MSKVEKAREIARDIEETARVEYPDGPQDEVISDLVATVEWTHDRTMMLLVAREVGL